MTEPAALRGLVLAGGMSTRLGRDKAAVTIDGQTLLERAVAVVQGVVGDVHVAVHASQVNEPLRSRFRCIVDRSSGIGPAAGVLSAHVAEPAVAWLVLACDMPWVDRSALVEILAARVPERAGVGFWNEDLGGPEPLCALYEPATLAAFRRQVEADGNPSLRVWLASADVVLLKTPRAGVLDSINLRADLDRLAGAASDGMPFSKR